MNRFACLLSAIAVGFGTELGGVLGKDPESALIVLDPHRDRVCQEAPPPTGVHGRVDGEDAYAVPLPRAV